MAHLKRHAVPKNWPLPRKGTAYVVRPRSRIESGVPVLVALRDMLKVAENRKEVKRAIHHKSLLINDRLIRDERNSLQLFDAITIVPTKKSYRLTMNEFGKYDFEEIAEKNAHKKVSKVVDKALKKNNKMQINLGDGRNYLVERSFKCNTNDSVIVDLKAKKIEKCLPLDKSASIIVVKGKHAGKQGKVTHLLDNKKQVEVEVNGSKEKINVLISFLVVTEK